MSVFRRVSTISNCLEVINSDDEDEEDDEKTMVENDQITQPISNQNHAQQKSEENASEFYLPPELAAAPMGFKRRKGRISIPGKINENPCCPDDNQDCDVHNSRKKSGGRLCAKTSQQSSMKAEMNNNASRKNSSPNLSRRRKVGIPLLCPRGAIMVC